MYSSMISQAAPILYAYCLSVYPLVNCLFNYFVKFSIELSFSYKSSLYTLGLSPLSEVREGESKREKEEGIESRVRNKEGGNTNVLSHSVVSLFKLSK